METKPSASSAVLAEAEAVVDEGVLNFEEFFRSTHVGLFRALCLIAGSREEAEDVMQLAFLRVFERWDRVRSMENAEGYLYRVAINELRSRYRRAARALQRMIGGREADDALAAVEDRDEVLKALRNVSAQQRAAIVLTTMLGFSSEEAGRLLGISASAVRSHATKARDAIRANHGGAR